MTTITFNKDRIVAVGHSESKIVCATISTVMKMLVGISEGLKTGKAYSNPERNILELIFIPGGASEMQVVLLMGLRTLIETERGYSGLMKIEMDSYWEEIVG